MVGGVQALSQGLSLTGPLERESRDPFLFSRSRWREDERPWDFEMELFFL